MGHVFSRRKCKIKPKKLSRQENERLQELFNSVCENPSKGCTESELRKMWADLADTEMLNILATYFATENQSNLIDFKSYSNLFLLLMRGTADQKCIILMSLITGSKNEEIKECSYGLFVKYVKCIISSYLMISNASRDYQSWPKEVRTYPDDTIDMFADAICYLVPQTSGRISSEDIQNWMFTNDQFSRIHVGYFLQLYNLEDLSTVEGGDCDTLIPFCQTPEDGTHSLFNMTSIFYINSYLHWNIRDEWSILFSTRVHGDSFYQMVSQVANRGPTVIVIKDNGGHIFGGYCNVSWSFASRFTGDHTNFLFSLKPEMRIYVPSGANSNYQYLCMAKHKPRGLGLGGQINMFGIWLEANNMRRGTSCDYCMTFQGYKMVSATAKFDVIQLEIWGIGKTTALHESVSVSVSSIAASRVYGET